MNLSLGKSGQGTMEVLLAIPIVVIGLLVVFIILEPISQELFNVLDASNSAVISNITTIKLLVGLIGLVVTALVIMRIVNSFRQRPGFPQQGFA